MKIYGVINFYSCNGQIMETLSYKTKEEFNKEIEDSFEIGRPIDFHIENENNDALER